MNGPRPNPVPALLVAATLSVIVVRANRQWLQPGGYLVVGAVLTVLILTSGRKISDWVLAVTVTGGLGAALLLPGLTVYAVMAVVAVWMVVRRAPADRRRRPLVPQVLALAGAAAAATVLAATEFVELPVAVITAGVGVALAADLVLVRRAPSRLDRWAAEREQALLDRWAATAHAGTPARAVDVVAPLLATAAAAVVLTLLGRAGAARVVVVVAGLIALACWYAPALRPAIARGAGRFADAVSRVLAPVLLLPVFVLVVVPVALLRRLLRRPGLDLGWRTGSDSYWLRRESDQQEAEPLDTMFADDAAWRRSEPASRPTERPAGAWALRRRSTRPIAVALALALIAGFVATWITRRDPEPVLGSASSPGTMESAAMADSPWRAVAFREIGEATSGIVYTPFVGWSLRDYSSRYVNVRNRVRASYQPQLPAGTDPVDVWFFGGSTMFGYDLQRDEHTIASEVARLAEAAGIPVRVRNYGTAGYVNYQEAALFSLLIGAGERPDVVVFYDGANDTSSALQSRFGDLNNLGEPGDLEARTLREALASAGPLPGLTAGRPSPLVDRPPPGPPTATALADDVVAVYRQGRDQIDSTAARVGVPVVHFWQPTLFTRAEMDPGERSRLDELIPDPDAVAGLRRLEQEVRARLDPDIVDLAAAIDGVDGPVFTDTVHVNETGAAAVARAMWSTLAPVLDARRG